MISAATLGIALLWALGASALTWLASYPFRRRSVIGLFASVVLTGTAASLGALLGAMHEMLLPMQHWQALVVLTVLAGLVATGAATAAVQRLSRDNRAVRAAIADVAAGRVPATSAKPLTSELETLRAELTTTAQVLADTRERERSLESARRELVAWVSHDLRTPLAGLRAMTEALEDGLVDDPHLYYKQIADSTDRLSSMVDDLFELSRLNAGVRTQRAAPVALDAVVHDVLAALAPLARSRDVELSADAHTGTTLVGDGAQLGRAVTNLVANAIRHTPAGGTVAVRVSVADGAGHVAVADECGGIPDGDLARVFDMGFRGEAARTPDGEAHAGLGLAIAQGIAHAHHGEVGVHNDGPGCVFTITLPLTDGLLT